MNEQELRAKALEITVLILGSTDKNPLKHRTDTTHLIYAEGDSPESILMPYRQIVDHVAKYIQVGTWPET